MPKLSIITPCYNAEKYIAKLIDSVIASTFTDWEYLVVDDGSTDNSADIIASYAETEPRLQLIRQSNHGVCNARNNGFKACSPESEYLIFVDADDCVEPQMLEVMLKYLDTNPHVGLACSDEWYIDSEDRLLETPRFTRFIPTPAGGFEEVPEEVAEISFFSIAFGLSKENGPIYRKSVYLKTSGWSESFGQGHEAWDLFLQMVLISDVHYIPQKLYKYRQHPTQCHKKRNSELKRQMLIAKWKEGIGLTSEQKAKVNQALDYVPAFIEYLHKRDQLYFDGNV